MDYLKILKIKKDQISQTMLLATGFFLVSFAEVFAQESPAGSTVKLKNYLNVDTIEGLLLGILEIVLIIAVPIIIFFIIFAGFLYVTARGDTEKLTNARRALTYAVIGGVLVLGAIAITEIIRNLVEAF